MWMKTTNTILSNRDFVNGCGEFVTTVQYWGRKRPQYCTASEPVIVPESEAAPRRVHPPTDPAIVLVVEIFQVYHHIVVLAVPESAANPAGQEARIPLAMNTMVTSRLNYYYAP